MMHRRVVFNILLVVGLLVAISGISYADASRQGVNRPEYVEGEILVKFKEGASTDQIQAAIDGFKTEAIRHFAFIDVYHLKLPANLSVEEALQAFQKESLVEYAVPNSLRYLDVTVPNDPDVEDMWGLHNAGQTGGTPDADIDAPEAWDITTGSSDVVIAVIDSGADLDHEDLAANIWTNPGEIPGNGIDDDGNGYIDDVHGWDFSSGDNDPSPAGAVCGGHGTHVAGTIGAVGNNGTGVVGVNWNVKVMPLKAFKPVFIFCTAEDADLIAAIEYHTMMGVRISSNSWGGSGPTAAMRDAIRASNSVFVAAAGNENNDNDANPHYPSSYQLCDIIAVAATDDNDKRASFSNYGLTSVDLGAPGVDILSTLPGDTYGEFDGTSMATPHVAGVAGLLLAQDPNLTNNEVIWRILNGVDDVGLPVLTGGRLNAYKALQFGLTTPAVTVEVTPLGPTNVSPGDIVSCRIGVTNNEVVPVDATVVLYVRLDDGRYRTVGGPVTVPLDPGETISRDMSGRLPGGLAPGTAFRIFGQAETAASFDEDWVGYTVVP
jgi:subtilisin family serine protease